MNRSSTRATPRAPKARRAPRAPVRRTARRTIATAPVRAKRATTTPQTTFKRFAFNHAPVNGPRYALSTKETTQLSGFPVIPNGREVLESLYLHTIDLSRDYYSKTNKFMFKAVENNSTYRLNVLRHYPNDDFKVERVIGAGQIEQLIAQAELELVLLSELSRFQLPPENQDINDASALPVSDHISETVLYPLPQDIVDEIATGKVSLVPYHPTKPLSRKLIQYLGFGELIDEEGHKKYDELFASIDQEKDGETIAQRKAAGLIAMMEEDYSAQMLINKDKPLDDEYYKFFETSTVVHPELDVKQVEELRALHEVYTRKH